MPLDPNIILGAKPAQIDFAQFSPINTLMTAMKFKQLDQEGQLNALTLKERKDLQTFMAENPDLTKPETRYKLATQFGESGRKLSTGVTEIGKAQTE
jgi:2-hydroxychromene-2-carboxylate isomerase